jgi:hypothetical protein
MEASGTRKSAQNTCEEIKQNARITDRFANETATVLRYDPTWFEQLG